MTARVVHGDNSVEINNDPGETPEETLASYTQELEQLGHEIIFGMQGIGLCKTCHKNLRYYISRIGGKDITIYSDFEDGGQCSGRHMSAFIGFLKQPL